MSLCLVGCAFAFPANASAESGSVTNIQPVAGGQLQATFTVSHSYCTGYGYCGWFGFASQVPAAAPCDTSRLIWVATAVQSTAGTVNEAATFYPLSNDALRLCVYAHDSDNGDVLVGQVIYTPSSPSPPPSAPTSQPSKQVPPLTIAEGRASVVGVLRDKFGGRFTARRGFKRDCYRLLVSTVRCRVRWDHGPWRYSGAVDMKNAPDDPENSIAYRTTIRRTRQHTSSSVSAPGHPAPSNPTPAPSPAPSCDPSYKGACLKPNVSDYDCAGGSGDGPYYVQGPITVVGDDHYGLDRDGDGIACES